MASSDQDYYRERARKEREMAGACTDLTIANAHRRMAEEYEKRVQGEHSPTFLWNERQTAEQKSIDERSANQRGQ